MQVNSVDKIQQIPTNKTKKSKTAIALGGTVGMLPSAYIFKDGVKLKSDQILKLGAQYVSNIMPEFDTFENIRNVAQQAMKDTGLATKGIKIRSVNSQNINEITNELINAMGKQPFGKNTAINASKYFEYGANAAYVPNLKNIYISEKGCYSSVFHEMGHAMNNQFSKIGNILQKGRLLVPYNVPILGLGLFAASLLHKVKQETEGQPKSGWEKTKDFVKNNVGKLTFLSFVPTLIEEAMASFKGINIAKKYLPKDQIVQLTKNYQKAFKTYGLVAVLTSAGIGLGNLIAQAIQNKKDMQKKQA